MSRLIGWRRNEPKGIGRSVVAAMELTGLIAARLVRRYKRFLADVILEDGREITVHCPNTGAMTGCMAPGSRVWLRESISPRRKYRYTWELVETGSGAFACIHSARANALLVEALERRGVPELAGYRQLRREAWFGVEGSRVDLLLSEGTGPDCYVEVKSVTLHVGGGVGLFPDAVSVRGRKHLRELMAVRSAGLRAVLMFVVQHGDIARVAPADRVDPLYAQTLRAAMAAGVEVLAYGTEIAPQRISLSGRLPVLAWQPGVPGAGTTAPSQFELSPFDSPGVPIVR